MCINVNFADRALVASDFWVEMSDDHESSHTDSFFVKISLDLLSTIAQSSFDEIQKGLLLNMARPMAYSISEVGCQRASC